MSSDIRWPVVGHASAVARFQRALAKGNLGHAYLITGPEHSGKTHLALLLAQALNCAADSAPCMTCSACERIAGGNHPDVRVISLTSASAEEDGKQRAEISIKQVRDDIQHWASLPPFEGKRRVFIISGAEMLSEEAANCLLKTLEEPQAGVLFVLITSDPSRLPETVVSRCQRVDLRPVSADAIQKTLVERGLSPEKAKLISRLSHGRPGWALEAASGEKVLEARDERIESLLEATESGIEKRFEHSSDLAGRFAKNRGLVLETLDEWAGLWRDMLLLKSGLVENITNLDYRQRLQSLADGFNIKDIRDAVAAITKAHRQLRRNANARLALDVMMLDMPLPRQKTVTPGR
jgi:DNA polymerase III subunit delta'